MIDLLKSIEKCPECGSKLYPYEDEKFNQILEEPRISNGLEEITEYIQIFGKSCQSCGWEVEVHRPIVKSS